MIDVHLRGVLITIVLSAVVCPASPVAAAQQAQPAPAPPTADTAPLTAAQVQLWFEAFTVLQAQDALKLSEAQYGGFVTRFKALQKIRREHHSARARIIGELRRMTNPQAAAADEAQITDRLRLLREQDERAAVDVRKAYDAVDETLDVRQRARFRIFEERMEQQKLEFLMRARQNARALGRRGRGTD